MSFCIGYDAEHNIIEGVFTGLVNSNILKQYSIDCEKIYKENRCNLSLSDYRDATFEISVVDIYRLPQKHNDLLNSVGLNIHILKRAAVFSKEAFNLAQFFEDVAVNRGQKFKGFTDKVEALEWLLTGK